MESWGLQGELCLGQCVCGVDGSARANSVCVSAWCLCAARIMELCGHWLNG